MKRRRRKKKCNKKLKKQKKKISIWFSCQIMVTIVVESILRLQFCSRPRYWSGSSSASVNDSKCLTFNTFPNTCKIVYNLPKEHIKCNKRAVYSICRSPVTCITSSLTYPTEWFHETSRNATCNIQLIVLSF
ncbi:hypothetical protein V1477_002768 [Vespula maculifrons]|uniref:Uncharacterized protein n=1 Tax=Vespula maculifrons TaxID=7453 RepID=A0ABD2CVJ0_VESMC